MLDWKQKENIVGKNEMVRQHHQFNGHGFQQTPEERKDRQAWHVAVHESQRVRGDLVTEQQKDRKKLHKKESINQQKEKQKTEIEKSMKTKFFFKKKSIKLITHKKKNQQHQKMNEL